MVGVRRPDCGGESLWRLCQLGVADHLLLRLVDLGITAADGCRALVVTVQPFALFHFAGKAGEAASFRDPFPNARVNALGTLHLLDFAPCTDVPCWRG